MALRLPLVTAVAMAATVVVAEAAAHGPYSPAHGYISTVSSIKPNVLGLEATVIGDRLLVRNWSGKTVTILDPNGRPSLRLDERGVFERTRQGWRQVSAGTSFGWHDPRARWVEDDPPAVVRREPDQSHYLRAWSVPGTADGVRFVIYGLLGYRPPPPSPDSNNSAWWSAALAGAAALAGLALIGVRMRSRSRPARAGSGSAVS